MRQSKVFLSLALGTGLLLPAVVASGATMTINTTEPVGAVIANPHTTFTTATPGPLGERDTFTTAFSSAATSGREDRGQTFQMPDNPTGPAWDLSAVTIRADANPDGSGFAQNLAAAAGTHSLRLWIFEWNPSSSASTGTQWTAGDGPADNDPFDGTGITNFLVNGELFDVSRAFSGEFLHFNTPGVQLNENTGYGYLVSFESPGTAGLRFDHVRDGTAPTGRRPPTVRSSAPTPRGRTSMCSARVATTWCSTSKPRPSPNRPRPRCWWRRRRSRFRSRAADADNFAESLRIDVTLLNPPTKHTRHGGDARTVADNDTGTARYLLATMGWT